MRTLPFRHSGAGLSIAVLVRACSPSQAFLRFGVMNMNERRVLISGASIAGLACAYWLRRHGFSVTIVEIAPSPRPGAAQVDGTDTRRHADGCVRRRRIHLGDRDPPRRSRRPALPTAR